MASKNFFKVSADLKKPTQKQIELVRGRALQDVRHSRKGEKLDSKSVESLLRIVSGRYSGLHKELEIEHRRVDNKLDRKFSQGVGGAQSLLIKINQDIQHLQKLSDGENHSGINYPSLVERLAELIKRKKG